MPVGNRGLNHFSGPFQPGMFPWSQSLHQSGTLANLPHASPANNGFYYFTTDGGFLYRSNGLLWVQQTPCNGVCILTDAATVNLDVTSYVRFYLQMTSGVGANRALTLNGNAYNAASVLSVGQGWFWELILVQPASGGPCTISSYGATITWSAGTAPTLTTTASKTDFLAFQKIQLAGSAPTFGFNMGLNY